ERKRCCSDTRLPRRGVRPHLLLAIRSALRGRHDMLGGPMDNRYLFLTERDFVRVMALQPGPALRAELERAIVVPPDRFPSGVVGMYSHVRYRDEHAGVSRRIQIVLPE